MDATDEAQEAVWARRRIAELERTARIGLWEYDRGRSRLQASREALRIVGLDADHPAPTIDEALGLVEPDDRPRVRRIVGTAASARAPFDSEVRLLAPDGESRTVRLRGSFEEPQTGVEDTEATEAGKVFGTVEDVTERRRYEEHLWRLADRDQLTGLFARRRFMEELEREVLTARRYEEDLCVLMLDVDGFKHVNDSFGHALGDRVLVTLAELLRHRLRESDIVGRLGGDEFALVLPRAEAADARAVAEALIARVRDRVGEGLEGLDLRVTASVGVAPLSHGSAASGDQLLVEADLAMYKAKRNGGDRCEVFDEMMRVALSERVERQRELRGALDRDEFITYYQPIVSVEDGAVIGCEALVRWQRDADAEPLAAGEFVPLAEEIGLIVPIGEKVLADACRTAAAWRRQGQNVGMCVNVSPKQLAQEGIVELVRDTLRDAGLASPSLCLEITETSVLHEPERVAPVVAELRRLGVRIAIDDFGSGASSLSHLRMLPVDVVKIDRSFVRGLADGTADRAIVAAVVSLAREMGLTVIAEGVEDEAQHWELRELGCQFAQGYLYGRPNPPPARGFEGFSSHTPAGVGDPFVIREFMRQIGIPARIDP